MKKLLLPLLLVSLTVSYAQHPRSFSVHFDLDRFNLTQDATSSLDSFVTTTAPGTALRLFGHTDIMAGYDYNDALSLKRTHAVKQYLLGKGWKEADIIEERGFGKRRPLNRNHGEWEMYLNRRVEIIPGDGNQEETEEKDLTATSVVTGKSIAAAIADSQATVGTNIVLRNMNFYGGTHVILPESLPVLLELLEVMKKNPALEIAVEGHICCQEGKADGFDIGTHTNNLSENRAREICLYLSRNGIASARLKYKGFGHEFPLTPYPEKTEEERSNNRRVEIKILKK